VVLKNIQTIEHAISEELLAQFIPQMFNRVKFRCIGWQGDQSHVNRNDKRPRRVPSRSVEHHDYPVARVPGGHLVNEHLHAVAVYVRQNQSIKYTVGNRNSGVSVCVLLGHHRLDEWTDRLGTPATSRIANTSEAGFVLEHHPERSRFRPLGIDQGEEFRKFFFHSSCAATSALGCLLSGASFRQP